MKKAVSSPPQEDTQGLVAKLVNAGYLAPALRNNGDAVAKAIARMKEHLRGADTANDSSRA
jgi:hypothetical protein